MSFGNIVLLLPHLNAFYFSCQTGLGTSVQCGKKINRRPCLTPDLREKTFSHVPLNIMLAVGFSEMAFIRMRKFPSIPNQLSGFYHERLMDFVKCFFFSAFEIIL